MSHNQFQEESQVQSAAIKPLSALAIMLTLVFGWYLLYYQPQQIKEVEPAKGWFWQQHPYIATGVGTLTLGVTGWLARNTAFMKKVINLSKGGWDKVKSGLQHVRGRFTKNGNNKPVVKSDTVASHNATGSAGDSSITSSLGSN